MSICLTSMFMPRFAGKYIVSHAPFFSPGTLKSPMQQAVSGSPVSAKETASGYVQLVWKSSQLPSLQPPCTFGALCPKTGSHRPGSTLSPMRCHTEMVVRIVVVQCVHTSICQFRISVCTSKWNALSGYLPNSD
eukprot:COSAG02_NODE_298_length_25350_cov_48.266999_21_plen_134_part_00